MDITVKAKDNTGCYKELGLIVALERRSIRIYFFLNNNDKEPLGYLDILKEDYDDFCLDILNTNRKIFSKEKELNKKKNAKAKCRNSS